MNAVFADAGYWIALFNPRDRLHDVATAVSQTIQNRSIVTSQLVLMEFLNYYASLGRIFRQRAVEVARSLQQYPNVEVVPLSVEQFEDAPNRFFLRRLERLVHPAYSIKTGSPVCKFAQVAIFIL